MSMHTIILHTDMIFSCRRTLRFNFHGFNCLFYMIIIINLDNWEDFVCVNISLSVRMFATELSMRHDAQKMSVTNWFYLTSQKDSWSSLKLAREFESDSLSKSHHRFHNSISLNVPRAICLFHLIWHELNCFWFYTLGSRDLHQSIYWWLNSGRA